MILLLRGGATSLAFGNSQVWEEHQCITYHCSCEELQVVIPIFQKRDRPLTIFQFCFTWPPLSLLLLKLQGTSPMKELRLLTRKKKHERIANFQPINSEGLYIVLVEVTHLVVTKMRLESTRKKKSKFENASS